MSLRLRDETILDMKLASGDVHETERVLRIQQEKDQEQYRWHKFQHLLKSPRRKVPC